MITSLIKYFTLLFCSYYSSHKISKSYTSFIRIVPKALFLSLIIAIFKLSFPNAFLILPIIFYVISECIGAPNMKYSFIVSVISYSLNQIIFSILSIIVALIFTPFWTHYTSSPDSIAVLIIMLLQFIVIWGLFRVKRFRNGMPFLQNSSFINTGCVMSCVVILYLFLHMIFCPDNHKTVVFFQILICLVFIPLIIWWRHKIKESYLAYLREFELTQLHQQINDLSADNERLSRIVHKDNKLVSAMASSVLTLLEKAPEYDREEFLAQCDSLHKELSELSLHRQELLVSTTSEVSPLGNSHKLVESVLSYEVKNARHSGICTKYNIDNNFMAAIETYLTDEELAHILADLIQNAIIAMKTTAQQNLLINLHMINGNPTISVMDSGTEFSPEVLQNLGLAPCSTHLDEGGSGIGLMDIWQLKIKSKASMVIKELPQPGDYTKQLSIIFDGKNKYVVFTNRKQELTKMINRFDMYIESV